MAWHQLSGVCVTVTMWGCYMLEITKVLVSSQWSTERQTAVSRNCSSTFQSCATSDSIITGWRSPCPTCLTASRKMTSTRRDRPGPRQLSVDVVPATRGVTPSLWAYPADGATVRRARFIQQMAPLSRDRCIQQMAPQYRWPRVLV